MISTCAALIALSTATEPTLLTLQEALRLARAGAPEILSARV